MSKQSVIDELKSIAEEEKKCQKLCALISTVVPFMKVEEIPTFVRECQIHTKKYQYEVYGAYCMWNALEHGKIELPVPITKENLIAICQTELFKEQKAKMLLLENVMGTIAETMEVKEADQLFIDCGVEVSNNLAKLLIFYIVHRRLLNKLTENTIPLINPPILSPDGQRLSKQQWIFETKIVEPPILSLDDDELVKKYEYHLIFEGREDQHMTFTEDDFGDKPCIIERLTNGATVIFHKDGRYEVI